jgi:hypothetical protein
MRLPEKEAIGDIGYTWYGTRKVELCWFQKRASLCLDFHRD